MEIGGEVSEKIERLGATSPQMSECAVSWQGLR